MIPIRSHTEQSVPSSPLLVSTLLLLATPIAIGQEFRPLAVQSRVTQVQPLTGIALWAANENAPKTPIQLEFAYVGYSDVIRGPDDYSFEFVDRLLDQIASRQHQAIVRFYDTYVGKPSMVPQFIRQQSGYAGVDALSEGKQTGFPDWSHKPWQQCTLDFLSAFAKRYDTDPRLAYLQVGFGLWSEYHIYDGPMKLGKTFPSMEFQTTFFQHMEKQFRQTPWMISVDAADNERTPLENNPRLLAIPFGLFDDSINHKKHAKENAPNWKILGLDRWKSSPAGGEFSFFEDKDQRMALAPKGPHGIPFEKQAAQYHLTFIIGDQQPQHQKPDRIRQASLAMGYRFVLTRCETNGKVVKGVFRNTGVAPIYYDAYPAIGKDRSKTSLKGLLPNQDIAFEIETSESVPKLFIACDRLVKGQQIEFDTESVGWWTAAIGSKMGV
jgi:hypothetical protein